MKWWIIISLKVGAAINLARNSRPGSPARSAGGKLVRVGEQGLMPDGVPFRATDEDVASARRNLKNAKIVECDEHGNVLEPKAGPVADPTADVAALLAARAAAEGVSVEDLVDRLLAPAPIEQPASPAAPAPVEQPAAVPVEQPAATAFTVGPALLEQRGAYRRVNTVANRLYGSSGSTKDDAAKALAEHGDKVAFVAALRDAFEV